MQSAKKPIITICSSANFYERVVALQEELAKMGFTVIVPVMAKTMKENNDFEVSHYKTWLADSKNYHKKAEFMHGHFNEVARADAILVVNNEKHGIPNYIGGNVLMEMGLGFHLGLPIFILNDIPEESAFIEEIRGMLPTVLRGDIHNFPTPEKIATTPRT